VFIEIMITYHTQGKHANHYTVNVVKCYGKNIYSSSLLIRPLPPKAVSLIRPDFRCIQIVKVLNCLLQESPPLLYNDLFI
jgi:hypothetical protein